MKYLIPCITTLYFVLLSHIDNANAGNLDPLKGCVDPGTRDELQAAIDVFESEYSGIDFNPRVLELCKDTKIKFKKGDPRIQVSIPDQRSFVLKCEEATSCTIDGGNTGRHDKEGREQIGSGGFMELISSFTAGISIMFEGIRFKNFGATNDGGVFKFFVDGTMYVSFLKCILANNYAKFHGGAIFVEAFNGRFALNLKDTDISHNEADGFGGGVAIRNWKNEEEVIVRDSHFSHNWAKGSGGAMIMEGAVKNKFRKLFMFNTRFKDNKASKRGGGLFLFLISPAKLINCDFDDNTADRGEAYFALDTNLYLDNTDTNDDSVFSTGIVEENPIDLFLSN